jgi:hypothetical protein
MSISGTLIKGSVPTDSGTVSNNPSLVHVSGAFKGFVTLEVAPAGTTDFVGIENFEANVATPYVVPDTTALWRFSSAVTSGSAKVYFGV